MVTGVLSGIAGAALTVMVLAFTGGTAWGRNQAQIDTNAREIQVLRLDSAQTTRDVSSLQAQMAAVQRSLESLERGQQQMISILTSRTP